MPLQARACAPDDRSVFRPALSQVEANADGQYHHRQDQAAKNIYLLPAETWRVERLYAPPEKDPKHQEPANRVSMLFHNGETVMACA